MESISDLKRFLAVSNNNNCKGALMWISRLELTCFKGYQHQVFSFPEPIDGKNLVLIGGMNGYGKTSILEALYLCLYGKDAMVHLSCRVED